MKSVKSDTLWLLKYKIVHYNFETKKCFHPKKIFEVILDELHSHVVDGFS